MFSGRSKVSRKVMFPVVSSIWETKLFSVLDESTLTTLCKKANIDLEQQKADMHFAIHPGGPKIIDYVIDAVGLKKEQANWSYEILRRYGNMSSATIPHIFNEIVNDPKIVSGTKIVAMAFGPGLTATGLLLEKL